MPPKVTPPPAPARRRKHYPDIKQEPESRATKIAAWGLLIVTILAIVGFFLFGPPDKHWSCRGPILGQSSLITFGSCTLE